MCTSPALQICLVELTDDSGKDKKANFPFDGHPLILVVAANFFITDK